MNDYLKNLAANASIVRDRLANSTDGKVLSIYKSHEARRVTRVTDENKIEVLVGSNWHPSFLHAAGLRNIQVK